MKLVMIGGHTRNIGKTSVVEGIIRATADLNWTAVKITQFGHGICTGDCDSCSCADNVDQFSITEEIEQDSGTDTARFLAAGARRSLWVRTRQGELYTALPSFKKEVEDDEFVIVESNSLRRYIKPNVFLQVLDPSKTDFKLSARQFLDLSDGYVLVTGDQLSTPHTGLLTEVLKKRQSFTVNKENRFINERVVEFVCSMLEFDVSDA
jgi:molybdopterin-guanine dinucleotide biosynthesis protein